MGVKLDDEKLILALKCCSKLQEHQDYDCSVCPIREMLEGTQPPVTCCDSITMLLAAQRLEALTSTAADMLILSRLQQTSLIHFVEPMRIPTTTQQEHGIGRKKNGKGYIYDTAEIKNVRQIFRAHFAKYRPDKPIEGAVSLSVSWYFLDGEKKHENCEPKITPPDTDNLMKILKDELAKLGYYTNDAHVCLDVSEKLWTHDFEGIRILVEEIRPRRRA